LGLSLFLVVLDKTFEKQDQYIIGHQEG